MGDSLEDRLARYSLEARKLLGISLTPETLWNLAPWTWAVDWMGDIGTLLHNAALFGQPDSLVMQYGYVMSHTVTERTEVLTGFLTKSGLSSTSMVYGIETKTRRQATPFGFGVLATSFSAKQWAILAALGISSGPRRL